MPDDTQALLQAAIEITEMAAAIPRAAFRAPQSVFAKSDESPVTQADRDTETAIRDQLVHRFPDDGIYGEEHGVTGRDRARIWVVDPIDGTKSFVSGVPLFGMLMALVQDNRPLLGVVRFPALRQVYAGAPGLGATCDGAAIRAFKIPIGRMGEPSEVAGTIAYLLGPETGFVHGAIWYIDGGADAFVRPERF